MCSELGPPRLDTLPSIAREIEIELEKALRLHNARFLRSVVEQARVCRTGVMD